ncbi:transposase, partial [Salinibacter ruber]|uniref:transposase n=1 Tax=Salinibacter ruber TaxID=146919 RepID=UPI00311AA7B2
MGDVSTGRGDQCRTANIPAQSTCRPVPEDTEVVVVGDGAFHSTDLMEFIEDQGWHFCLRLHTDTYVRASAEGPWKQLRELV